MKETSLLMSGLMLAALLVFDVTAQEGARRMMEVHAASASGDVEIHWTLPSHDSVVVYHEARRLGDITFRKSLSEAVNSHLGKDADPSVLGEHITGLTTVDVARADFVFDRRFSGINEGQSLVLRMPAHQSLGVLKATFLVGDSQMKYQIMHFGFRMFSDAEIRNDILSFVASTYDRMDIMSKGEILILMFGMDSSSEYTRALISKAKKTNEASRAGILLRQLAGDLEEYLETGNLSLLERYAITL